MLNAIRLPRVMVFDSGVGSLSVGDEIHRHLPGIDLLYVMDRGGFPYGQWQEEALVQHICKRIDALLALHDVDLIVIACNSASTAVLPALRAQHTVPIVGVVPAIKPAAQLSKSKVIGLLATPGTVSRPYTTALINDFAADCCVISSGNALLAPAIEALFWDDADAPRIWKDAIDQLCDHPRAGEMDTVVLACTHFPLIRQQLAENNPGIQWIDSGEAIARRVASLLAAPLANAAAKEGTQQALILGDTASESLRCKLNQRGIALIPQ